MAASRSKSDTTLGFTPLVAAMGPVDTFAPADDGLVELSVEAMAAAEAARKSSSSVGLMAVPRRALGDLRPVLTSSYANHHSDEGSPPPTKVAG